MRPAWASSPRGVPFLAPAQWAVGEQILPLPLRTRTELEHQASNPASTIVPLGAEQSVTMD